MISAGACASRLLCLSRHFLFSTDKTPLYKFKYGFNIIPHPAKAHKGGEDAVFASQNLLVVADGVGGWADHGIDPGKYSKKLCQIIGERMKKNSQSYIDNPQKLLIESWEQNKQLGSTTVCMLALNPETGKIKSYYLGDSVFGIFRDHEVQMVEEQQKAFNFPYQIGSEGDHPTKGISVEHQASNFNEDDLIVVGTDGLWDNMYPQSIHKIVKGKQYNVSKLAEEVSISAKRFSFQEKYESPFYTKAKQAGYRYEKSGKPDDISVIVARIIKQTI